MTPPPLDQQDNEMLVPHSDLAPNGLQPVEVVPAEAANAVDAQSVDDPPSARFTWTIENFARVNTKRLYSEIFYVGGYKWRVLIFPKGNNVEHLSMYLDVADSATLPYGWSRYAQFSLAVINQLNNKFTVRKDTQHQFNARESDWGFTSFLPLSELHPGRGYLVNDTIIVEADVAVRRAVDYWSHDSKKETGYVEVVVAVLNSQGSTKEIGENGSRKEESELPSEDNSSGNVEANNTEMSPPQPPLQPNSDTLIPSVHAPHPGSSDATSPAGKVRFLSCWVSAEASRFLERVHSSHKDTFSKFSMKGQALQTMLLESLASFIESMSTTMVNTVDEEAMRLASVSIEDFEQVGLDLSWMKQRLDKTKRVNRYLETVTSIESKESALEVARAKLCELEEGLAKAKAELEAMWEGLPKSLGGDDYVLKDVV